MDFVNLLLMVISNLNVVSGTSVVTDYGIQNVLTGKTCPSVVFTKTNVSAVHCATLCGQHEDCKSLFYDRGAMICTGCDVFYTAGDVTSWPDDAGTLEYFGPSPYAAYGQSCLEKPCLEDNVCFSGLDVCVCDPATNYDPTTGSCVQGCTKWGDTYQKYPSWKLDDNNFPDVHSNQYDFNVCLEFCSTHNFSSTCYGVDYKLVTKKCYYNKENPATSPSSWKPASNGDFYNRNCG